MTNFKKKDLLLILNIYQKYINQFVNINDEDLNNIYLQIAKEDFKTNTNYKILNNDNRQRTN